MRYSSGCFACGPSTVEHGDSVPATRGHARRTGIGPLAVLAASPIAAVQNEAKGHSNDLNDRFPIAPETSLAEANSLRGSVRKVQRPLDRLEARPLRRGSISGSAFNQRSSGMRSREADSSDSSDLST